MSDETLGLAALIFALVGFWGIGFTLLFPTLMEWWKSRRAKT